MDSIKGVLVGLALFFVSFPVLFLTEWNYVEEKKALEEGAGQVVSVKNEEVDAANEGKLVHTNGKAETDEVLADEDFGVSVPAMRLERGVEMRQWKETSKEKGKGSNKRTVYEYEQVWSSTLLNSGNYQDKSKTNPAKMPYSSKSVDATSVSLGAFELNKKQIAAFPATKSIKEAPAPADAAPVFNVVLTSIGSMGKVKVYKALKDAGLPITTAQLKELPLTVKAGAPKNEADSLQGALTKAGAAVDLKEGKAGLVRAPAGYVETGDGIYKGNPQSPQIGDVKIEWKFAPASSDVTIVAKQVKSSFGPFETSNGRDISDIRPGKLMTAQEVFDQKQAENVALTWFLRFLGFFLMGIGLSLVFRPLVEVASIVPILGDLIGIGFLIAAFGLAAALSLVTIAISWLFFRPLLALGMILVGGGILFGLITLVKKAKAAKGGGAPDSGPAPGVAPAFPPAS